MLRAVDLDDDAGKPLIFSLTIDCVCTDGDKCGEHGQCVAGICKCFEGYFGVNCDSEDPCDAVDCGAHGHCVDGTCNCSDGYTGTACETSPCNAVDCGAHGRCVKGSCECTDNYNGTSCEQRPLLCCGDYCDHWNHGVFCDIEGFCTGCRCDCPAGDPIGCEGRDCCECDGGADGYIVCDMFCSCMEYCNAHSPGWARGVCDPSC